MIRTVQRVGRLSGAVSLPGDKSISHRYAMLAALADGASELRRFASSRDCRSTLECLRSLGVAVRESAGRVEITSRGLHSLRVPERELDAGNSGTTMRLISGILAGQPFESRIGGDESLSRRPMGRILDPLRKMGARVTARAGDLPPLVVRGGRLRPIRYELPVASAQVKSCVLLAGLFADGPTAVREAVPTRNHTEVALREFGATVRRDGEWIEVDPEPRLRPLRLTVPGDLSGAAFFLVAAGLVPGSELVFPDAGLNPTRGELLAYLRSAGLPVETGNESVEAGEPRGDVHVRHSPALPASALPPIRGALVAALIDEIPVLAVLGSQVAGGLEVSGAAELRVKESDRISAVCSNLRAMGAAVEERPDGFAVAGSARLHGADIVTGGDHRVAMAFGIAGLVAEGDTRIHDAGCADVSFPGFWETLETLTRA